MKKVVLTFGIIAGLITVLLMFITIPFGLDENHYEIAEILGYVSMLVALSFVFFGIKVLRDKHQSGKISFGKGFVVGLYISIIASLFYAAGWELYLKTVAPDFMERFTSHYIENLKKSDISAEELAKQTADMESMKETYKNPFLRFGMTMSEILPVGIIVSLISAGVLRKREVLPA